MVQTFEQYIKIASLKIKIEEEEDQKAEQEDIDKNFSVPNFDQSSEVSPKQQ